MDEIEVVDHQIQHDADIGAPPSPWSGADTFDAQRCVLVIEKAASGENETILVTHGQNQTASVCERNQFFGFVKVGGNRLLDEHMGARRQKRANDLGVG